VCWKPGFEEIYEIGSREWNENLHARSLGDMVKHGEEWKSGVIRDGWDDM
jgi:hypothetical protein